MFVIANQLKNPVSTRYDDIYHPRTDKRVIRKYIFQINRVIIDGDKH